MRLSDLCYFDKRSVNNSRLIELHPPTPHRKVAKLTLNLHFKFYLPCDSLGFTRIQMRLMRRRRTTPVITPTAANFFFPVSILCVSLGPVFMQLYHAITRSVLNTVLINNLSVGLPTSYQVSM
jgi:hypothetical protein